MPALRTGPGGLLRTAPAGFTRGLNPCNLEKGTAMKAHFKQAAITLAVVLVGIYVVRKLPVVGPLADTALNG